MVVFVDCGERPEFGETMRSGQLAIPCVCPLGRRLVHDPAGRYVYDHKMTIEQLQQRGIRQQRHLDETGPKIDRADMVAAIRQLRTEGAIGQAMSGAGPFRYTGTGKTPSRRRDRDD
jgi:hypothetical protein